MKIKNLKLVNFRNYDDLEIEFSPKINIIYGNNGSGKSNLVEAIYLLALTKSFRTLNDDNLIKQNKEFMSVEGNVENGEVINYRLEYTKNKKNVFIDRDRVNKLSDYVSRINIVIFNPLDDKIISDAPVVRRKLLNIDISQLNREYIILLNDYDKVLKNRNAYLKQLYLNGNASSEYLDILTMKLIDYGLKIHEYRQNYINDINQNISKIYKNIFETGELVIKYKSIFNDKTSDQIREMYKKAYRKEMEMGKTLLGIHHDDIEFILDGTKIRDFGSVGQQKNAIISFKLSELLIFKKVRGDYPILILDDLFSELDNIKINNIIKMLNMEVQTFITTTDIDSVNKDLIKNNVIFKVNDGNIERIDN